MPKLSYGMAFGGEEGTQEPTFLEEDIKSITLLAPKATEEILYSAVDNGTLYISNPSYVVVVEGSPPSGGVLWNDVVRRCVVVAKGIPLPGDHENEGVSKQFAS